MAFTDINGSTSSSPPSTTTEPDDISLLLGDLLHRPLQPPIPSPSPSLQPPIFISCSYNSTSNPSSTIFHHNSIPPSAIFSGSDRLVVDRISDAETYSVGDSGFNNPGYFRPFGGGIGGGSGAIGTVESESGSGDCGGQFRSFENETEDYDCESEEGAEAAVEEELQPDQQPQQTQRNSTKRSRAAQVHNLSEKRRRSRINEKMKALQNLIPNSNKTDKASMLDEAIEYLKQLQLQVQMLSVRNGLSLHPMCVPGAIPGLLPIQLSQMGMDVNKYNARDHINNTTLPTTMNTITSTNNTLLINPDEPSSIIPPNPMFNLLSIPNQYAPLPPRPHVLNNTEAAVSFDPGSSSHHLGAASFGHLTSSYQEICGRKDGCLPHQQLVMTQPERDSSVEVMMQQQGLPHHTNATAVSKECSSSQHRDMLLKQETLSKTLDMPRKNQMQIRPRVIFDGL